MSFLKAAIAGGVLVAIAATAPVAEPMRQPEHLVQAEPACADRTLDYVVRGLPAGDRLTIRDKPTLAAGVVAGIPADATGIRCQGPCRGQWCLVSWEGKVGWVDTRYLSRG